jgi:hypothetical protein
MMDNLYGKMFKTLMGEFGGQSDLMLSIKTGVESEKIATLDEATKAKVADMFDPHRKEREDQITKVIKPLISEVLSDMEPPMRAGSPRLMPANSPQRSSPTSTAFSRRRPARFMPMNGWPCRPILK